MEGEGRIGPEHGLESEEQLYEELRAADAEVGRLMQELDDTIATGDSRAESERQALESLIPAIDAARARAQAAHVRWLEATKKL